MNATVGFDELQRSTRCCAMERAKNIPQGRRLEPARQLHGIVGTK